MVATWKVFAFIIPSTLICLMILCGNLGVILAVITQKNLRTVPNIYILSLALADLAVGIFVLPIGITQIVLEKWILGRTICHAWITLDVTLCTVSILHLCLIGLDRYRCITDGVSYMQKRTSKSAILSIISIWVVSLWISSPPVLGWTSSKSVEEDLSGAPICELTDEVELGYAIHSALGSLIFPLITMLVLYYKIYRAIQKRLSTRNQIGNIEESVDSTLSGPKSSTMKSVQMQNIMKEKLRFSLSRERKAAKTLGVIMGGFIVCWLPYGFLYITTPFLPDKIKPSQTLISLFTWLGYFNSLLNPIIYTVYSAEFRKGFRRLLHI